MGRKRVRQRKTAPVTGSTRGFGAVTAAALATQRKQPTDFINPAGVAGFIMFLAIADLEHGISSDTCSLKRDGFAPEIIAVPVI